MLINLSFLIPEPTGISVYANNILPYLKALEPVLLTSLDFPEYNCYSIPGEMTPKEGTEGHLKRLLWTQFSLPKIYREQNSNLLFSPIPEAPLYSRCRYVVMSHDLIPLRFPRPRSRLTTYFRYYIPQVLHQAVHIICNSLATAQDLVDFYHLPREKITPIPLAYDRRIFRFLDLPTSNYFLYIGRQDSYKNLHRLIEAFAALPARDDYQLWLAGPCDETYTPQLKLQVTELGLNHLIKFLSYVPIQELVKIINQAIAVVFPSLWEGFGFPVLEAMACGTPVITSNLSSLPEVAGDATILINPYQVEEITEAMNILANNQEIRSNLRKASLNRASQFSWKKTGEATAKVLQNYR